VIKTIERGSIPASLAVNFNFPFANYTIKIGEKKKIKINNKILYRFFPSLFLFLRVFTFIDA
jgi:hypothetical protein